MQNTLKQLVRIAPFTTFFLIASIHLINARLDPDIHHDGIIYAAAVASSQGLLPNRDYFTQYGPVTSIMQGIWLYFTEPTLYSLRIFNVAILLISSYLVYKIIKTSINFSLALLILLALNISTPTILPYLVAWPSVISTMILLLVLLILQIGRAHV